MGQLPNWVDGNLYGYRVVQEDGAELPQRATLNLKGAGVAVVDNESTNSTDVTIDGSGGSGGTPLATPDTLALRDGFGGFAVTTLEVKTIGGATGAASRRDEIVNEADGAGGATQLLKSVGLIANAALTFDLRVVGRDHGNGDACFFGFTVDIQTDGAGVVHHLEPESRAATKFGLTSSANVTFGFSGASLIWSIYGVSPEGRRIDWTIFVTELSRVVSS